MKTIYSGWLACRPWVKLMGGFLFLVLLLWGRGNAELVDRVVAMVNDDIILQSELDKMLDMVTATMEKQGYPDDKKRQILSEQRNQVLEQLIYDKLSDQQIKRYNLTIEDEQVDAAIERIRNANRLSEEALRKALEDDGMTFEDYRKEIKEKMLRSRLVNMEVKSKIVVTGEDVQNYYDAHLDEYGGRTKYELRHILLKVPSSASESQKADVFDKIKDIHKRLEKGESFEKMAERFSQAPSAQRQGMLGVFSASLLTAQIRDALKGVEPKQFTPIVDTDQGFQIFYVEQILSSGGRPLDEVRAEIQEKLYADVVDRKFNEWIKDLRKQSHIQILD